MSTAATPLFEDRIPLDRAIAIGVRGIMSARDHIANPPVRSSRPGDVVVAERPVFRIGNDLIVGIGAVLERVFMLTQKTMQRRSAENAIRAGRPIFGIAVDRVARQVKRGGSK